MEREVARSRSRRQRHCRWLMRRQRPALRIEPVDEHLAQPEVGRQHVTVRRVWRDEVWVWPFLALGVRAGASMLPNGGRWRKPPALHDRQDGDAPACVIRDQHVATVAVETHMTRIGPV